MARPTFITEDLGWILVKVNNGQSGENAMVFASSLIKSQPPEILGNHPWLEPFCSSDDCCFGSLILFDTF